MFGATKKFIRKYKKYLKMSALLSCLFACCVLYLGYNLHKVKENQKEIVDIINDNVDAQDFEKVKTHSISIKCKMDDYEATGNLPIDEVVMGLYKRSYELALKGDKLCYVVETMADVIYESYKAGVKDGNKMWGNRRFQS